MNILRTVFSGVVLIEPKVYEDNRGFFYESYNQRTFTTLTGVNCSFVQDNHSRSEKHVLRGLHYQLKHPQGKLVRVIAGEIFDVVVDLRRGSPDFGRWAAFGLSETNRQQLWVPVGFAHGFLVLSDYAEVIYKTTEFYAPEYERCILWQDAKLSIKWPLVNGQHPRISEKDGAGLAFRDAEYFQ